MLNYLFERTKGQKTAFISGLCTFHVMIKTFYYPIIYHYLQWLSYYFFLLSIEIIVFLET